MLQTIQRSLFNTKRYYKIYFSANRKGICSSCTEIIVASSLDEALNHIKMVIQSVSNDINFGKIEESALDQSFTEDVKTYTIADTAILA